MRQPGEQQARPHCGLTSLSTSEPVSYLEGDGNSGLDSSSSDERSMVLASDLGAPQVYFRPISFVLYIAVDSVSGGKADCTRRSGGRRLGRRSGVAKE